MELCLYKGLFVALLLHLCQGRDPAIPPSSPEFALPSLGDVMDAVKSALFDAVKISKDDVVRVVFEQAAEEFGPQENVAEKPPATADDTGDRLPAVVREQTDKETTSLGEENAKQGLLNSSEGTVVLQDEEELPQGGGLGREPGEKPVESIERINKSAEGSVRELEDPDPNLNRDPAESNQEPKESLELDSEGKSPSELHDAQVWSFDSGPEGQREDREGKQELVESEVQSRGSEMEKKNERVEGVEVDVESKIQNEALYELAKHSHPQPDQDHEPGLATHDDLRASIVGEEKQTEDDQRLVDDGGRVVDDVKGETAAHIGDESVEGLIPASKATEMTSQELDVLEETNDLNAIVTPRYPVLQWKVPKLGSTGRARPPFPTLGPELGESDDLVEEPADTYTQSTTPKQEAWKIGVIAIALFLILQTLVIGAFILKRKRKRNRVPGRVCAEGIGAAEHDEANAQTDEQTAVDELPERSEIQQETFALTPVHAQSTAEKSFNLQN